MDKSKVLDLIAHMFVRKSWISFYNSVKKRGFRTSMSLAFLKINNSSMLMYSSSIKEIGKITFKNEYLLNGNDYPLFSIILPVHKVKKEYLISAIESVKNQSYQNWELCICHDAPYDKSMALVLEQYSKSDKRIKVTSSSGDTGIANASNQAITLSNGSYIGFLDHDDELAAGALRLIAEMFSDGEFDIVYTDEDKMDGNGKRSDPFFKPDWSRDLLYSHNYITHLCVYKRWILNQIGGFRSAYDGSQDYDLILRGSELTEKIGHLKFIAYHWRMISGSVALDSSAKPYAYERGRLSLQSVLESKYPGVEVSDAPILGYYKISFPVKNAPKVSIIIATKDHPELLYRCINSILTKTMYDNYEIIIINNGSTDPNAVNYLRYLQSTGIKVVEDNKHFNHSRLNNLGAYHSAGQVLLFLNNDIEVVNTDWLREMVSHVIRPGIGCVGARLLYPNGTIQHSGVVLGLGGGAAHPHRGFPSSSPGYFGMLISVRNYSAVTGACMAVLRDRFDEIGGFDELKFPISYNDVDFCLRLLKRGYRSLVTPHAKLIHHESASRSPSLFAWEIDMLRQTWPGFIADDPYYSPYLTTDKENLEYSHSRAVLYLNNTLNVNVSSSINKSGGHDSIVLRIPPALEEYRDLIYSLWRIYHMRPDLRAVFDLSRNRTTIPLLMWAIQSTERGEIISWQSFETQIKELQDLLTVLETVSTYDAELAMVIA
ncbi:glycosyltransferase family 2 protein [Ferroacidibacillus organovorans]|uniref:Glycosyltransferase 2-like domain-containing protein n=1 Tax=Ferroacidibacillus organovorans TaxID=1765683 RepID=A0A1V4ERR1_9BACL|nr:glycosyltransferase family 2 protein [Ferroacidibacillus organovorans]OPG15444.1 hypothetical protein B2M26_11765 [Ferroacidibacillus organovorans]